MEFLLAALLTLSLLLRGPVVLAASIAVRDTSSPDHLSKHCFPALGFVTPQRTPEDFELEHWWCDPSTEYAFVGFSYEVTACGSAVSSFRPLFIPISRSKPAAVDRGVQGY